MIKLKTLWEKEKLLVTSNFSFSHNDFKSCCWCVKMSIYGVKGQKIPKANCVCETLMPLINLIFNKSIACRCQHSAVGYLIMNKKLRSKKGHNSEKKKKNAF